MKVRRGLAAALFPLASRVSWETPTADCGRRERVDSGALASRARPEISEFSFVPLLAKNAMRNTRERHVRVPVKSISTPTPTLPQFKGEGSEENH